MFVERRNYTAICTIELLGEFANAFCEQSGEKRGDVARSVAITVMSNHPHSREITNAVLVLLLEYSTTGGRGFEESPRPDSTSLPHQSTSAEI